MKVGITGHQRLDDPNAWGWVRREIGRELDSISLPVIAFASLAIGADQLFAQMVTERGGGLYVVIPFKDYERTFAAGDVEAYRRILAKAARVDVLRIAGDDEDAYLAAGKRIVDSVDLMMAVWNGEPAKGKGGTADIVRYADRLGVPLVHLNPASRMVTRRQRTG